MASKRFMLFVLLVVAMAVTGARAGSFYAKWSHGPSADKSFFPIGVWVQDPAKALQYRRAGINVYVALWKGPTEAQLHLLKQAGVFLICAQNEVGLAHKDDPTIIGWMHGDEPDNAQPLPEGKGWGPPIPPEKIVADYERLKAADPTRPIMLNLGQGVAWDTWYGRGVRTNHPEDYAQYVKGCDIASFDIYPVVQEKPEVAGKLWYVAQGVERLRQWAGDQRIVWDCIECTRIQNPKQQKATPHQVRCEVWMSLIKGSMGLIYFVHEWQPKFNESALLSDAEMLAAVTQINHQIAELAPALNSPTVADAATVVSKDSNVPVAIMAKRYEGATYLFAVAMRDGQTQAHFTIQGLSGNQPVEVLGESRTLTAGNGAFDDDFKPWDVHLYRIGPAGSH